MTILLKVIIFTILCQWCTPEQLPLPRPPQLPLPTPPQLPLPRPPQLPPVPPLGGKHLNTLSYLKTIDGIIKKWITSNWMNSFA